MENNKIRIYALDDFIDYSNTFYILSLSPISVKEDEGCYYKDVYINEVWSTEYDCNNDLSKGNWLPWEGTFYYCTYDDGNNEVEWKAIYKEGKLISKTIAK